MTPRRFPPPWTSSRMPNSFWVQDSGGQTATIAAGAPCGEHHAGQLADYYPVIAQAVHRLEQNTAQTRQTIYDRARAAMAVELHSLTPPLGAAVALERGPTGDRESVAAAKLIAKLSPRERQVLDKLVAGRSTKQMAYDLGISARTVEVHRARMLARLGTHSLAEAIRLAVLAGLLPADLEANAADRQRRSGASRGLPE
jgi:DNA-binding CsgD family transcriptional regulator